MDFFEETLEENKIFQGKVVNLITQKVKLPNGLEAEREIIRHPGGVAILAFKDEETILLVEQFRKPLDKILLEIPAGKLEKGEKTDKCGIRELEEETGYKCNKFTYLGKIVTAPGFCDEYIYLYKAEDLYKGIKGGDDDEFINVKEVKLNKIKEMIKSGEIEDGKTIAALMYI
ncbi:NUDIX hydrolase [Clostridium frigidicarnis]|uniref:ADP-ribose pyrophosphatase n=1 Tax=Clostridium frigidicarnis TaxID=84698 RepID=A0A1I0WFI8_9CLOT|nr:NUDIX hydrolase [Clostridium frigidicarnis]SFA87519.1 ADP-ribose pyrophosphatase [Clostridium frigidicarnis]